MHYISYTNFKDDSTALVFKYQCGADKQRGFVILKKDRPKKLKTKIKKIISLYKNQFKYEYMIDNRAEIELGYTFQSFKYL